MRRVLAIWRESGARQGEALALTNLGRLLFVQGEYDSARALYEESLAVWRVVGNKRGIALCLTGLGFLLYAQKEYSVAQALYKEGLAIQREIGNKWGVATLLSELGSISFMEEDYASARALHEESLAIFRDMGHKLAASRTGHSLALVIFSQGENEQARTLLLESLATERDLGDKDDIAANLAVLGAVAAETRSGREQVLRGVRLLGASDALIGGRGGEWLPEDRTIYERGVAAARDQLDEEAFRRAFADGHAMSIEDALAYALDFER